MTSNICFYFITSQRHATLHLNETVLCETDINKKVNRKAQEVPQAEIEANLWHQEEEKKVSQNNVCIANKQMHDKHKDQLPLPQARWSKC